MPIGPFKNWDECVAHQKSKGYDDDVSKKICGKIESMTKEAHKKKLKNKKDEK